MRLFYGLSLPAGVRDTAAEAALRLSAVVPGRYVPAENHHITLAFLGDVPQDRLAAAQEVLARCTAAFPPPRISLRSAGFFGRSQNAILILHAASSPSLDPLHGAMTAALSQAGLPFSPGSFTPHITLARHADVTRDALDDVASYLRTLPEERRAFTAHRAHLYLSARDGENVLRYTPLFSAPFK